MEEQEKVKRREAEIQEQKDREEAEQARKTAELTFAKAAAEQKQKPALSRIFQVRRSKPKEQGNEAARPKKNHHEKEQGKEAARPKKSHHEKAKSIQQRKQRSQDRNSSVAFSSMSRS